MVGVDEWSDKRPAFCRVLVPLAKSADGNATFGVGSAYPVGKNLILTAWHVLGDINLPTDKAERREYVKALGIKAQWPKIASELAAQPRVDVTDIVWFSPAPLKDEHGKYSGEWERCFDLAVLECEVPTDIDVVTPSKRNPKAGDTWYADGYPVTYSHPGDEPHKQLSGGTTRQLHQDKSRSEHLPEGGSQLSRDWLGTSGSGLILQGSPPHFVAAITDCVKDGDSLIVWAAPFCQVCKAHPEFEALLFARKDPKNLRKVAKDLLETVLSKKEASQLKSHLVAALTTSGENTLLNSDNSASVAAIADRLMELAPEELGTLFWGLSEDKYSQQPPMIFKETLLAANAAVFDLETVEKLQDSLSGTSSSCVALEVTIGNLIDMALAGAEGKAAEYAVATGVSWPLGKRNISTPPAAGFPDAEAGETENPNAVHEQNAQEIAKSFLATHDGTSHDGLQKSISALIGQRIPKKESSITGIGDESLIIRAKKRLEKEQRKTGTCYVVLNSAGPIEAENANRLAQYLSERLSPMLFVTLSLDESRFLDEEDVYELMFTLLNQPTGKQQ